MVSKDPISSPDRAARAWRCSRRKVGNGDVRAVARRRPKQVKVPVSDALPAKAQPDELRQARTWIPADTTRGAAGCARCVEMEEDPNTFVGGERETKG